MKQAKRKKLEKAGWKVGTAKQFLRSGSKNLRGRHLSPDEIHEITKAIATCNDPRQVKYLIKFAENRQKALENKPKKPVKRKKRAKVHKGTITIERKKTGTYEATFAPSAGRVGGQGGYAYGGPVV